MEAATYRCPHCGMPIGYDAAREVFYCQYCSSSFSAAELVRVHEEETASEIDVYTCPNCGAEILTDALTAATFCRFCGAPSLVRHNLQGRFRPNLVIPFSVSKEKVTEIFKRWSHHGRFTPKGFYKESIGKITGTYVPFWLFDCQFSMGLWGKGYKERSWRSGDYIYTKTSEYDITREGEFQFHKVPADGATKMEDGLMDALEPYDYQRMIPFDMPYLAGFAAEKYDLDSQTVFPRVDQRANASAANFLSSTISGYSRVNLGKEQKQYRHTQPYYAMLPVWALKYTYRNKEYTFAVNGQTGKVVGKPPVSPAKVVMWTGLISGICFLILTIGGALI